MMFTIMILSNKRMKWFQLLEIQLFHHNRPLVLLLFQVWLLSLQVLLALVIQFAEKNNGRPGLKISKIMAFNKRW